MSALSRWHSAVAVSKAAPQSAAAIVCIASQAALRARARIAAVAAAVADRLSCWFALSDRRRCLSNCNTRDRLSLASSRVYAISHARCCSSAAVMKGRSCNASPNSRMHPPSHSAPAINSIRVFSHAKNIFASSKIKCKHSITKVEQNKKAAYERFVA